MRKTTIINYDQVDLQVVVRTEIKKAGLDKVPGKLEQILEKLEKHDKGIEKIDHLSEVMDNIAGGIKDYREEQELNANKLSDHSDQLEDHDRRLKKLELPAL